MKLMSREKGQKYEKAVENFLLEQGYLVLERNWHAGIYGELDLVCRKDKTIVFIEVKGRSSGDFAYEDALTSITPSKAKKLLYSMQRYLDYLEVSKKIYSPKTRFDIAVVVDTKGNLEVKHLENISLFELINEPTS
ncbi:MAG TPA: YraN family protein [Vampirovibrionales bacterium]